MRIPHFAPSDRFFLTSVVLLFSLAAPTYAQAPRHGFWWDVVGLGFGAASFSCDTCIGRQLLAGQTGSFGRVAPSAPTSDSAPMFVCG